MEYNMPFEDRSDATSDVTPSPSAITAAMKGGSEDAYLEEVGRSFDAKRPRAPTKEFVDKAKALAKDALNEIKRLKQKASKCDDYSTVRVKSAHKDKGDVTPFLTIVFGILLNICCLTPIAIVSSVLVESDKLALLDGSLWVGMLFVTGVVSASVLVSFYRDTILDDDHIRKFDQTLTVVTLASFITFILALGLAAHPVTIGGEQQVASGNFGAPTTPTTGFTLETPTSVLYLAIGLFDVCAAGLLHTHIQKVRGHSLDVIIKPSAKKAYITDVLLPKAIKAEQDASTHAQDLEHALKAHEADRAAHISEHRSQFIYVRSVMDRAAQEAAEGILRRVCSDQPTNTPAPSHLN